MSDIKLSLTITLPGRVMMSEQECSENPTKNYSNESVEVYNEVSKRMETVKYKVRNTKPAQQVLNMSSEAYYSFISNSMPYNYKGTSFAWKKLKKNEKLLWHFMNIADELGGEILSYHVFDD